MLQAVTTSFTEQPFPNRFSILYKRLNFYVKQSLWEVYYNIICLILYQWCLVFSLFLFYVFNIYDNITLDSLLLQNFL